VQYFVLMNEMTNKLNKHLWSIFKLTCSLFNWSSTKPGWHHFISLQVCNKLVVYFCSTICQQFSVNFHKIIITKCYAEYWRVFGAQLLTTAFFKQIPWNLDIMNTIKCSTQEVKVSRLHQYSPLLAMPVQYELRRLFHLINIQTHRNSTQKARFLGAYFNSWLRS